MICGFSVCYYEDCRIENAKLEEGYVAGKNYDDCFQKIREWYFGKDTEEYASITISSIEEGWVDEAKDIVATTKRGDE